MEKNEWERRRDATLTQPLLKAARVFGEKSIEMIRNTHDLPKFRHIHTSIIPHIDLEGTRQTEIARRMNVSKQAIGPLINEMVGMEVLKQIPDPKDGRAKLISFNQEGPLNMDIALEIAHLMEKKIEKELGSSKVAQLKELLWATLMVLEKEEP